MSRHRSPSIRPRYGRIVAVCSSSLITLTAVLGGTGVLPTGGQDAAAVSASMSVPSGAKGDAARDRVTGGGSAKDGAEPDEQGTTVAKQVADPTVIPVDPTEAPADSGEGRRVVFSQAAQRVWLIDEDDTVERTYLVSGSVYDNLDPGTFAVYSRSEKAWGIDDSGTMNWFVRFAHGPNAAIGFHDIPVDDGQRVQTADELGTPRSHGCIRQRPVDAKALWEFAPIGTTVVVI
ncbi:L,D-transpeptidase [Nocardioides sp. JQ2195]|uniref:L,D-transpeptidase n=1 Tax=Nocardioides sp. JQ2195 TaxID=2592334 RepID=UPI00143E50F6|nr:L,D-transpeptidase [Nocardioides sp. JQ2195]QIX27641.1 L,D-transpeptidase [Nocardioides sp. JQ2195]